MIYAFQIHLNVKLCCRLLLAPSITMEFLWITLKILQDSNLRDSALVESVLFRGGNEFGTRPFWYLSGVFSKFSDENRGVPPPPPPKEF